MLQINPETVCFIIVKAREFDAKEDVVEADPGSNPADEGERGVLADYPDDPVFEELENLIDSLNEDEQADLVALAWVGREDYTAEEWNEAVAEAQERRTGSTAKYLLGMPLLADYLEEGLSQLGYSCADEELGRP
ncbi:MAG: DUF3775 domain-containing protein [Kiloniellaceae bacterium]